MARAVGLLQASPASFLFVAKAAKGIFHFYQCSADIIGAVVCRLYRIKNRHYGAPASKRWEAKRLDPIGAIQIDRAGCPLAFLSASERRGSGGGYEVGSSFGCVLIMKLTFEILHSAGKGGIGFNWHQLRVLGVPWPPPRGWLQALIGTEIDDRKWQIVMELKATPKNSRNKLLRSLGVTPGQFACSKLKDAGNLLL